MAARLARYPLRQAATPELDRHRGVRWYLGGWLLDVNLASGAEVVLEKRAKAVWVVEVRVVGEVHRLKLLGQLQETQVGGRTGKQVLPQHLGFHSHDITKTFTRDMSYTQDATSKQRMKR